MQYWWILLNHLPYVIFVLCLEVSQLSLILCGYLWCFENLVLEVHLCPLRLIWAMCFAFMQKSYRCIYDFRLDTMCFTVYLHCVCMFLWGLSVHLETYTHEGSYIFNWYSKSLVITFYYFLDSLVISKWHKLCFSIGFTLPLNKLVILFDLSSWVCLFAKYMICTMCLIFWKTMVMLRLILV